MIRVYDVNEKLFNNNGIKILKPLKADVFKVDNGDYYCEFEDTTENIDFYQKGMIIQVPTPWGSQGFRCNNPEIKNNRIYTKAKHIYYDTENYVIADSYVVNKNCNDALDHLNNATDNLSPFKTLSNVGSINTYRCVRNTLSEAIDVVLERWGGHLVRDNFNIAINENIGADNGVVIAYGRNLMSSEVNENWDDVCTKILPVGKDGLLLDELYLEITEKLYDVPYSKTISFSQDDISEENYENEQDYLEALKLDLRNKATKYLESNKVPKVNYKVTAWLQDVTDVGDVVYVKHPKIKLDLKTNVIAVKYDAINKKYKSIEFGNYKQNLNGLLSTIEKKVDIAVDENVKKTETKLNKELDEATSKIWSSIGGGYVIKEENQILVLDTLPKENAKNVIVINKNGIGFGKNGINGQLNSAWTIDGTLDMQQINCINLVADMIKGGTLKLGSKLNESGLIELYDEANKLISKVDKDGITIYCDNGDYIKLNASDGFVGYDNNDNKIYWVSDDEFHMKKSVVEEEITLCGKMRMIPITITDENGDTVNDGIGYITLV